VGRACQVFRSEGKVLTVATETASPRPDPAVGDPDLAVGCRSRWVAYGHLAALHVVRLPWYAVCLPLCVVRLLRRARMRACTRPGSV
jgi:hypothetical protein